VYKYVQKLTFLFCSIYFRPVAKWPYFHQC
jgi:hypothetical protein